MKKAGKVRVSAVQYSAGPDVDANLATTLRMIDQAAEVQPDILVLPEFINHLSWYDDKNHCWDVSVDLDGPFLTAIAEKAKKYAMYISANVTLRRGPGKATGSSVLIGPDGNTLGVNDKQIYIGHENDFLEKCMEEGPVVDTPVGRLAMYACMDGVIAETPRTISLRGAQILLNSVNSFAPDEGCLHIPVRAPENRVFVVAANKVGPLVPEMMLEPIAAATGIPPKFLCGSGESQIVAPDGTILAIASADKEELVWADIDPSDADNKARPDGTDVWTSRRPEIYGVLGEDPAGHPLPEMNGADQAKAAVVQATDIDTAVSELEKLAAAGVQIACLPALCGVDASDPAAAMAASNGVIAKIRAAAGDMYVATSLVRELKGKPSHVAVLVGKDGVVLEQGLVHASARYSWSATVEGFATAQLPIGRVALMIGDDGIYPEAGRLLAMTGAEVACVPTRPVEAWELETGLLERSAENRVNYLVASEASDLGTSFITGLQKDFTVLTEWETREFDGWLSQPILTRAAAGDLSITADIYPAPASNKVVSRGTDMLAGRPWHLSQAITKLN